MTAKFKPQILMSKNTGKKNVVFSTFVLNRILHEEAYSSSESNRNNVMVHVVSFPLLLSVCFLQRNEGI